MRCRLPTPHQPSTLGLNWGSAVNRQKIWRRPSLSAYVQTGARWLLGRGLPPVRLPSPVMHAASPTNGPTPPRTTTTWNIVRGVGMALASANDICASGDARMHHFPDEDGAVLKVPADLPKEVVKRVQDMSVRAFRALGCETMARVDFFLHPDMSVVVNEVNTIPGFRNISMYPLVFGRAACRIPSW